MSPRIGISTSFAEGEQRLHHAYVQAVEAAGGLPVIIPMLADTARLTEFAEMLDGLLITGGPAVTDGLIGTLPSDIDETHPIRVHADKVVLAHFLERRRPVLGICYGMQLLNAQAGGTIYGDVERQVEGVGVHSSKRGASRHNIRVDRSSQLGRLVARDTIDVNTRHIQAIASVGEGFRVCARADDGVIEAIESTDGLVLGVQFHPERMDEAVAPLFGHLVESARASMRLDNAHSAL